MDPVYLKGVGDFIDFAYVNQNYKSKIYCPCKSCRNLIFQTKKEVVAHLLYRIWTSHGESYHDVGGLQNNPGDDMLGMLHDTFATHRMDQDFTQSSRQESTHFGSDVESKKYLKLFKDAQQKLYPVCDSFTTLSFTVKLMQLKVLNGWSDKSFDMLVDLLKKAFPEGETLPKSYYEIKNLNEALGFICKKIDVCPQDCMLYWKDKERLDKCDFCHMSRYKERKGKTDDQPRILTNIPAKQIRYFPLKLHLQKLFISSKTASLMRWHAEERTKDGKIRHPADSLAWKNFDEKHPEC